MYEKKIKCLGDCMKSIRSTRYRPVHASNKIRHCYFGVRVTPEMRDQLIQLARERNISISAIIREMLAAKIEEYERKGLTDASA